MKDVIRYRLLRTLPVDADYPWHAKGCQVYGYRKNEAQWLATVKTPGLARFFAAAANAVFTDREVVYLPAANDNDPPTDSSDK